MGATTIEWSDFSINPIRARLGNGSGHYCEKVSPGCKNCYSSRMQPRFRMPQFQEQRRVGVEHFFDESKLEEVLRRRKPTKWFWCDMSDLFGDWVPNEWIAACFGVMAATPHHTHQVLTKRSKRMREWFEWVTPETIEKFKQIALAGRIAEYFADERTVPVAGWPGYFVTSRGRVLSDRKGPRRDLKPMPNGDSAHCRVYLYRDDAGAPEARMLIHRMVLEAFDRAALDGEQGRHIDGNPENNALWNLRWGTQSDNWDDRRRHGNGRSYHKLTDAHVSDIRVQHANGSSMASLAAAFGVSATQIKNIVSKRQWISSAPLPWPLPWVWLGVSAEDQQRADERIPDLLATPAAVRFISAEPLLGPIDFTRIAMERSPHNALTGEHIHENAHSQDWNRIDWVIVGGESGHGARACDLAWIRSIVEQCKAAEVPAFVKQLGAHPFEAVPHLVGGHHGHIDLKPKRVPPGWTLVQSKTEAMLTRTLRLEHRKGGEISEWPAELRVRQFPGDRR